MKRRLNSVMIAGMLLCVFRAEANNVTVSNVSITLPTAGTTHVVFDITWENSWRDAVNYDACWVFMKFSTNSGSTWAHATLAGAGANPPGFVRGGQHSMEIIVPPDKMGGFIQRSANGSGTVDNPDVEFVWDFSTDGVLSTETVRMQVFAVEMVFVPQASFLIGSGTDDEVGHFYTCVGSGPQFPTTNTYLIGSESSITTATEVGCLWGTGGKNGDAAVAPNDGTVIPAEFPKGYAAFYCTKYEMSQRQYCDFLNTLPAAQQVTRHDAALFFNDRRNFIKKTGSSPAFFGCDANDNAGIATSADASLFNESDDGEWVACNYVSWEDCCAYMDWAALRPMAELEFEKACRGDQPAVAGEYAWGNTNMDAATTSLNNQNTVSETPNQGNCNFDESEPNAPYRSGCFADAASTRQDAAASYYGISDLSGNMMEYIVTVGTAEGRVFTGLHGDGVLSVDGNANVTNWPGFDGSEVTDADGSGCRGGRWESSEDMMRVSDREYAAKVTAYRDNSRQARAVRTAP